MFCKNKSKKWEGKPQTRRKCLQKTSDIGLLPRIYKDLLKLNSKRKKSQILKNGQKSEHIPHQKRYPGDNQAYEKYVQHYILGNRKLKQQ